MSTPTAPSLSLARLDSPIGPLALATDGDGRLRGVSFADERADALMRAPRREYPDAVFVEGEAPAAIASEVVAYFAGDLGALGRIPWSLDSAAAGEGFQARVWRALADTAAGRTMSYGEIAARAGEPGAAQAVGVALNRNPLPLVLPCHRVVGADGAMVGFGGGLERKTWLLRHEGRC